MTVYYGGQGIKWKSRTRSLVDRLQSFQCELIVPLCGFDFQLFSDMVWERTSVCPPFAPKLRRLVIVSTVSGLGFQSGNRNSVAVGAPNLVLLWFQGDFHIEGHRFPLVNLSLHKDWIHSRSSSRHLIKQSCLDPTFFRPVFLVRLTIWNCLPGAWLHASEWRSHQK